MATVVSAPPRGRLLRKYAVILAALVAGALVASGGVQIWFAYGEQRDALLHIQREKAAAAAAAIEQFVAGIEGQLGWSTHTSAYAGADGAEQRRFDFIRLLRQAPPITELVYTDADGKEQLRISRVAMDVVGSGIDRSGEPSFRLRGPVRYRMRRRDLVTAAAGALLATSRIGQAQTDAARPVVAYLGIASPASDLPYVEGLRLGLRQLGYVPGATIELDERYADGSIERFRELLGEVLARGVEVIVVPGIAAALAVRELAPEVPVVAVGLPSTVLYPDLFASLHRPGGSVTGFSPFGEDLAAKRVELLRETVPDLTTLAILHNAIDPLYRSWGEKTEEAARQQGLQTLRLGIGSRSKPELDALMRSAQEAGAQGLIIVRDFLTHLLQEEIARRANAMGMATMAEQRVFVEQGGLMSYGADLPELFRRAATYVDEILNGASPAEMPIQLATEFELVVSQRTATELALTIPTAILLRAEVLE